MVAANSACKAAREFRHIVIIDGRAIEVTMVGNREKWPGQSRAFDAGE
jgi:hypothetical protein